MKLKLFFINIIIFCTIFTCNLFFITSSSYSRSIIISSINHRNNGNFNLRRVNSELKNEKNEKINNIEVTSILRNVLFTSSNNCKNENAVLIRITNPNNANWVLYRKWKEELEENNFDVWFLIIGEGESVLENTIIISSKEILTTYQYLEDLPYQLCGFP